jgi:nitroreductase
MSPRPVPAGHLRTLAEHARRAGALLVPVTSAPMRQRLTAALTGAARRQEFTPGYEAELQLWTRRYAAARDGVSAASIAPPPAGLTGVSPLRRFPHAQLSQPQHLPGHGPADAAELVVIATAGDDPLDWLRAGEATSAVLLAATRMELATTPLSQAVEAEMSRRELQHKVLQVPEYPQLIIRVGWPASGAAELPVTPRRDLSSVLLPA